VKLDEERLGALDPVRIRAKSLGGARFDRLRRPAALATLSAAKLFKSANLALEPRAGRPLCFASGY